jgi:hypothetical protein
VTFAGGRCVPSFALQMSDRATSPLEVRRAIVPTALHDEGSSGTWDGNLAMG